MESFGRVISVVENYDSDDPVWPIADQGRLISPDRRQDSRLVRFPAERLDRRTGAMAHYSDSVLLSREVLATNRMMIRGLEVQSWPTRGKPNVD